MIAESILAMILSLGIAKEDRAPEITERKHEQLETVARSIAVVAETPELAAMLITLGWFESKFAIRIAEGRCKPFECDRGRARGPFQIHRRAGMTDAEWDGLLGTNAEATLASTREAARRIRAARVRCRSLESRQDWAAGVFSSLAGRGCVGDFKGRAARTATFRKLLTVRPNPS